LPIEENTFKTFNKFLHFSRKFPHRIATQNLEPLGKQPQNL